LKKKTGHSQHRPRLGPYALEYNEDDIVRCGNEEIFRKKPLGRNV